MRDRYLAAIPDAQGEQPLLTVARPETDRIYWPQLDGLRTLAFLLVFVSHLPPFPILQAAGASPVVLFGLALWNSSSRWGWIGVELFFVLSAFLITTLLLRERQSQGSVSFRSFFVRRALRIWPLYFFVALLGLFLLPMLGFQNISLWTAEGQAMLGYYVLPTLVFLSNFCFSAPQRPPAYGFVEASWSVSIEEQFYVVWGLLLARIKSTSTLYLLALTTLPATFMVRMFLQNGAEGHVSFYYNTFAHLDSFMIGILLALLMHEGRLKPALLSKAGPVLFFLPVAAFLLLALFVPKIGENHGSIVWVMSLISVLSGALLLSLFAWEPARKLFSWTPVVRVGQLTYGLYFFHFLGLNVSLMLTEKLFQVLHLDSIIGFWGAYSILGLLLSGLLAFLSWHFLEKRFYFLRKRFSKVYSGFG